MENKFAYLNKLVKDREIVTKCSEYYYDQYCNYSRVNQKSLADAYLSMYSELREEIDEIQEKIEFEQRLIAESKSYEL